MTVFTYWKWFLKQKYKFVFIPPSDLLLLIFQSRCVIWLLESHFFTDSSWISSRVWSLLDSSPHDFQVPLSPYLIWGLPIKFVKNFRKSGKLILNLTLNNLASWKQNIKTYSAPKWFCTILSKHTNYCLEWIILANLLKFWGRSGLFLHCFHISLLHQSSLDSCSTGCYLFVMCKF